MKRIIAAVALLFSVNVFAEVDRTLWLNDEICNMASGLAGTVAEDVIKEQTVDSFSYDEVLQFMAWAAFNETQVSGGIRKKQLQNNNVAMLWLREVQFSLHGSIKRSVAKYGNHSVAAIERAKAEVSQTMFDQCQRTTNFQMSPLTVPNPENKKKGVRSKVKL